MVKKLNKRIIMIVFCIIEIFYSAIVSFSMNTFEVNGYNNYNNYNFQYNPYLAPQNNYFYIISYDRPIYSSYNGEPMHTRIPILVGYNLYYVNMANGLVKSAYDSMSNWCNNNLFKDGVQDYFLNYAYVERATLDSVVMLVNCGIKKKGIIDNNIEFRLTLNLSTNRYKWKKLENDSSDYKVYEYDSGSEIIIIK